MAKFICKQRHCKTPCYYECETINDLLGWARVCILTGNEGAKWRRLKPTDNRTVSGG